MPNPDPGRDKVYTRFVESLEKNPEIFVRAKNKEPEDFLKELASCKLIIGNSSCILREASFIGVPAINVGDRQKLRERGVNVIDCDFDPEEIQVALKYQSLPKRYAKSYLYGTGSASEAILKFLDNTPLRLKEGLTYPYWQKYKESHFGKTRFDTHRIKYRPFKKRSGAEASNGVGLQSQS
jgi:UDP-N-acetylglucosamine 2-epimerase